MNPLKTRQVDLIWKQGPLETQSNQRLSVLEFYQGLLIG